MLHAVATAAAAAAAMTAEWAQSISHRLQSTLPKLNVFRVEHFNVTYS
jgi:hypothetical protein